MRIDCKLGFLAYTIFYVVRFLVLLDSCLVFFASFIPVMCISIASYESVLLCLKATRLSTVKTGGRIMRMRRTIQYYLQLFMIYQSAYYMAINMYGITFFLFLGILIMCNTLLLLSRVILRHVSFSVFCVFPFACVMITFFVASFFYYPTMFFATSHDIISLMKNRFSRWKYYRLKVRSLRPIKYGIGIGTNAVCFFDRNTFLEFFNVVYTKSTSVFVIMIVLKYDINL